MVRTLPWILTLLCGVAAMLTPLHAMAAPKRVAVLPLNNKADLTPEETTYLTDMVRSVARRVLPQARFLIMTDENFELLLGPGKSLADCIGECAVQTGKNLKAHYVVTGSVIRFGKSGSLRLSLKAHATRTGNPLMQVQVPGETVEAFEAAVGEKGPALFAAILNDVAGVSGLVMAKSTTRIYLIVTPKTARISLNGRPLDLRTVKRVEGGLLFPVAPDRAHELSVEADGFQRREQKVYVRKGRIERVLFDLPPTQLAQENCTGDECLADLEVRSTPPNAEVWIDGVKQADVTNPTLNDSNVGAVPLRIPAGRRIIEVRLNQYERAKTTIDLKPGDLKKTPVLKLIPNFGALVLKTSPPGAVVKLNGVLQNARTPLTVPKIEAGPLNVELELADHHVLEDTIFIGRGGTTERTLNLKPAFGAIVLRVEHGVAPLDGVAVNLVGREQKTTQGGVVRFERVSSGPQKLMVRDPLYGAQTLDLNVRDGETTERAVTLDARYAELTVNIANGIKGALTVANRPIPIGTQVKLPAGQAQVRFTPANAAHYHPYEATWALGIGDVINKTITLKARQGQLTVITNPSGAQVFVDGVDRGLAPVRLKLFAGKHKVKVVARGYKPTTQTVELAEDSKKRHVVNLGQKPTLVLSCSHPDGQIELNGIAKGKAPQTIITSAGIHDVVCRAEGAQTTQRVELAEGHRQEVNLVITKAQLQAAQLASLEGERATARTVTYIGGGLVIAGGISALLASGKTSEADDRFAAAMTTTSRAEAQTAFQDGERLDDEAYTLNVVGGSLVAAGVIAAGYGIYRLVTTTPPKVKGTTSVGQNVRPGWRLTPTAVEYTW